MMTPEQTELVDRLHTLLEAEPSTRVVSMFGGLSFMVRDKMVVSAQKDGDLLVRIPPERDDELRKLPGAERAEMGAGRSMGSGWITVSAESIPTDQQLSFWLDITLAYNQTVTKVPNL